MLEAVPIAGLAFEIVSARITSYICLIVRYEPCGGNSIAWIDKLTMLLRSSEKW